MGPIPVAERGRSPGVVTVVTPTLNAAEFIQTTLECVRSQSYGSIEHIVVDGGSSDDTLRIVREAGYPVRVIERPGLNQSGAVNLGFAHGVGEFFALLNADDILSATAIESGVRHLQDVPLAAVAYARADHIDDRGEKLGDYPVMHASREVMLRECVIAQPATLIRSSAYEAAGGLDESLNFAMDYDLWLRLIEAGNEFLFVDELWAHSRMHRSNKTLGQRRAVYKEVFKVLQAHGHYVPFNWIHGYAGYVADRRDQFFEPPKGSLRRALYTLSIGLWENRTKPLKFAAEYFSEMLRLHGTA